MVKWTKQKIIEAANNCSTKKEFKEKYSGAVARAKHFKIYDEVCQHMTPLNSKRHRDVYLIFSKTEKKVYVGITVNVQRRIIEHKSTSPKKVKQLLLEPHRIVVIKTHIDSQQAIEFEGQYIQELKQRGYTVLNSAKHGSLGAPIIKWTKESVLEKALLFNSPTKFKEQYSGAYDAARRNNWLRDVTLHMKKTYLVKGEELTQAEISKKYSIHLGTLGKRIERGWTGDKLIQKVQIQINKNDFKTSKKTSR